MADKGSRRNWTVRLLLVGAVLVAYYLGTLRPMVHVNTGVAHSAEGAISIEAGGWTYAVPLDGVMWKEAQTWHDGGRPSCLPPTGTEELVRFGAVDVDIESQRWKAVVWVDCR